MITFNRTIEELKFQQAAENGTDGRAFNRIFAEMKWA
jgi:hypothetical protein